MPPLSSIVRCSGRRSITGCGGAGVELGGVGAGEPAHVPRVLDHRALDAEADAEERARRARARTGSPRPCPRCPGRRSRPGPGCRRRPRGAPRARPARAARRRPTASPRAASWAIPPWASASARLLYESRSSTYLPTTAIRQRSGAGCLIRRTISSQLDRSIGPGRQPEQLHDDLVQPLLVEDEGHLVDRLDVLGGDDRLLVDVAEERDLRLDRRRQEAVRSGRAAMSGWIPIARSSFTECWVALVLSSPEALMNGTSVRWT